MTIATNSINLTTDYCAIGQERIGSDQNGHDNQYVRHTAMRGNQQREISNTSEEQNILGHKQAKRFCLHLMRDMARARSCVLPDDETRNCHTKYQRCEIDTA